MKNKKLFIIIGVILVLVIGIGAFIFLNSNNINKSIDDVKVLLEKDNYDEAYIIIKDKKLLSKANEKTNKLIRTRLTKYKVSSLDDYLELTNDDWKNIKSFNKMINDLDLSSKYNYLSKLIEIDDKYNEYIPAITWQNSEDYNTYREYMKTETQDDFEKSSRLMKTYSFEKYGLDNKHIKELNDEVKKFIDYCDKMVQVINTSDVDLYDSIYDGFQANIKKLYDIEVEIVNKTSEVEEAIKKLPTI